VTPALELTVQVSAGRGRARLPILRRAVAGTSSKADLPVDRIDDAILILEALICDAHTASAEEVHLVLTARPGSFELLMGPLAGTEAARLLAHAALPMVGPVIERLATTAVTVDSGSHLLVVVDAA
jgi:serine/threonine-protein kinase RsbW